MNNFSFSLQILTLGSDNSTILKVVDQIIDKIKSSGLNYNVGPFETTVEGNAQECLKLLNECILLSGDLYEDIFANIKIHYTKDKKVLTIEDKIKKHIK